MARTDAGSKRYADVYLSDPRLQPLLGPGGPFEVENIVLDGVPLRSFVRAPKTIMDAFEMGLAPQ
jgi:long-chain acyl-CoA synthetase